MKIPYGDCKIFLTEATYVFLDDLVTQRRRIIVTHESNALIECVWKCGSTILVAEKELCKKDQEPTSMHAAIYGKQ